MRSTALDTEPTGALRRCGRRSHPGRGVARLRNVAFTRAGRCRFPRSSCRNATPRRFRLLVQGCATTLNKRSARARCAASGTSPSTAPSAPVVMVRAALRAQRRCRPLGGRRRCLSDDDDGVQHIATGLIPQPAKVSNVVVADGVDQLHVDRKHTVIAVLDDQVDLVLAAMCAEMADARLRSLGVRPDIQRDQRLEQLTKQRPVPRGERSTCTASRRAPASTPSKRATRGRRDNAAARSRRRWLDVRSHADGLY